MGQTSPAARKGLAATIGPAAFRLAALIGATPAHAASVDYDALEYSVTLQPDFETKSIRGSTAIRFRSVNGTLRQLSFTDNKLVMDSASIDRRPVKPERDGSRVNFTLPRPLPAGRVATLRIQYHGDSGRGLVFGQSTLYSNYSTCQWMICDIDRPGDKAGFSLLLRLPGGMPSIASGGRIATRVSAGLEIHHWRERRPYSPYLFGFAAGFPEKSTRDHKDVRIVLAGGMEAPELERRFADSALMLDFFTAKAGLPFPHRAYTQILVPNGEAQEKSSFSLLGQDVLDPRLANEKEDWAVAHEMAHQWWGNLVTCKDWTHFWLNEGITSFMVATYKEQRWGRADYDREMELFRARLARAPMDVPLTFAGPYPSLGAKRAITYGKGALFMDALRTELGDTIFWAALKRYTMRFAGRTADSKDFQRVFEQVSGRDLAPLFDRWVY